MKQMFFKRVDQIILQSMNFRSLQLLLHEYRQIAREYGFDMDKLKSSLVKEVLIKEYRDDIGFHERPEKNKSEFVYDTKSGGNYIEAAFDSFGITDEQLILNLAPRLSKHIKEVPLLNWCPTVEQLLEEESVSQLLVKPLSAMKKKHGHKELLEEDNPVLRVLTSLITYIITGKKTLTSVNLTVVIHGMMKSKELIDILHRCGICISYNNLLLLYAIWALRDAEISKSCPRDIAYGKCPIVTVDNNDFKIDLLTGNACGAHQTNVLYVQLKSYEEESNNNSITKRKCQKNWM